MSEVLTARSHATVKHKDVAVCHNETGHKTVRFADTCAARATKTARPLATVISSNNNDVCPNTIYCRGIFTDDEDEGNEIVFSQTVSQTIGSHIEPGVSLDYKVSSHNAPSRAFYEYHTHRRGSDPRSVTAVNREAPSSGSSGNLGQGPWGERHPGSAGPASGSEGHYADAAVVDFHDGSSQYGAGKIDKTLARSTTTPYFHTGARSERAVHSHTGLAQSGALVGQSGTYSHSDLVLLCRCAH